MPFATSVAAAQMGDQAMTTSDRPSASAQGINEKSAKTGENISRELTKHELDNVCGGAFDTYMQFKDSTGTWLSGN
jgi:hypothetical protein